MPTKPQTSLLIGAVGLVSVLWLLDLLSQGVDQLSGMGTFSLLGMVTLAGIAYWGRKPPLEAALPTPEATIEVVEQALDQTQQVLTQLQAEAPDFEEFSTQLATRISQLKADLDRQEISLTLMGGKGVGKSTLKAVLGADWSSPHPCKLLEALSLFVGEQANPVQLDAIATDLVLFLVQADLTQPEYQAIQDLAAQGQRLLVIFNKQDQYLPLQRSLLLNQIQARLQGIVAAADVVAIAAHPNPITVRRHQADGSVQEWLEPPGPQVGPLVAQLNAIVAQESRQLIVQTSYQQALALKAEAQSSLNQSRRQRALPIIERYQWVAAAATFANPVPALDLLAAAAISGQMVRELGAVYQLKFSLSQAQTVAGTLASLMLKLGLVEFSTQTLGSLLKSNSITYVAGGLIQGASSAYLTRLAGLSLIEYLQTLGINSQPEAIPQAGLQQILKRVFQQNQQRSALQALSQQFIERLRPQPSPTHLSPATPSLP